MDAVAWARSDIARAGRARNVAANKRTVSAVERLCVSYKVMDRWSFPAERTYLNPSHEPRQSRGLNNGPLCRSRSSRARRKAAH
jgi:hypothetical protein